MPPALLVEPWRMNLDQQSAAGCVISRDYPAPIVDAVVTVKHAKDRLYTLRGGDAARAKAGTIEQRHGSRKSGLPPSRRRAAAPRAMRTRAAEPTAQLDLFGTDE